MHRTHPFVSTNQMQFVDDEQIHVLYVLALFPSPRQHVPLLGSTDDHVPLETDASFTFYVGSAHLRPVFSPNMYFTI